MVGWKIVYNWYVVSYYWEIEFLLFDIFNILLGL